MLSSATMVDGKIVVGIIFFLLAAALYIFYRWLFAVGERRPVSTTPEPKPWYSPFFTNPFSRARIKAIRQQHEHKRKEAEKEDLITEFGGKKEFVSQDFLKLKQLIHQQQKWSLLTPQEQDAFRKLQRLLKQSEAKAVRMSRKEREEIVKMLRKMLVKVPGRGE